MAKNGVTVCVSESVAGEVERMNRAIRERAYAISRDNCAVDAVNDWLSAEHELAWKPAIELRRKDGDTYEVLAATAGVPAKDLRVEVTPDDLLIKASLHHAHAADEGDVQVCEFASGALFRAVHFPEKIDPKRITTDYNDGLLRIVAPVAH